MSTLGYYSAATAATTTIDILPSNLWIDTTNSSTAWTIGTSDIGYSWPRYEVVDDRLPPVRKPPTRDFNKYLNGSDLLEEFIAFLGSQKVRRRGALDLPVELFVRWLVVRAMEEDGEQPEPHMLPALPAPAQPRCLGCQRFLPAAIAIPIHDERCAGFYYARQREAA